MDLATRLQHFQRTLGTQAQRLDVLAEVVRASHEPVESRRVAEFLVSRMAGWLPLASWSVWGRPTDDRRAPVLLAVTQMLEGTGAHAAQQRLAAEAIAQAHDVAVPSLRSLKGPHRAALAFTLNARGQTIGALIGVDGAASRQPPQIGPTARARLALFIDVVAVALDNVRRFERAEQLASTDDLTQLYNARFLGEALAREVKRSARTGRPLSLLFIDFDNFKHVNDEWGHLAGSRALVDFARLATRSTRETDTVARFGGDEFAIVLPDTDAAGAAIVAERIRDRVATHGFTAVRPGGVHLSVSIGVASLSKAQSTAEALVASADAAMYEAKRGGGNAIRVAAPPAAGPRGKKTDMLSARPGRMRRVV